MDLPQEPTVAHQAVHNRWAQLCQGHDFTDGSTVTAQKLATYLRDEVVAKGKHHREGLAKAIVPIGQAALERHVVAIVNLWREQVATGQSTEAMPRDLNVLLIVKNARNDFIRDDLNCRELLTEMRSVPLIWTEKGEIIA
ncbi:hypothetical protein DFS34DRAFT_600477 [Phlyctochytrium arcticum]|nr:hypothetical protein DFS34DRAFT_600477 [Phlyctochytrium arcticum]